MQETGVRTLFETKFECPACGTLSRIPESVPTETVFRLTCYRCGHKALVRLAHKVNVQDPEPIHVLTPNPEPKLQTREPASNFSNREDSKPESPKASLGSRFAESLNGKIASLRERFEGTSESRPWFQKIRAREHEEDTNSFRPPIKTLAERLLDKGRRFRIPKIRLNFWLYLLPLPFVLVFLIFFWIGVIQRESEVEALLNVFYIHQPTVIYDRDGKKVSEIFGKKTSNLEWDAYPENLKRMVLLVEDRNFYSHGGIHYSSLLRAFFVNVMNLRFKQGASTITQQLSRILLNDREKSLERKLKEAQLAYALESHLDKQKILLHYMNNVYLGHGAFGFDSASEFYFGKKPKDLNLAEMIVLASLASAPNRYSPLKNPDLSLGRVEAILRSLENDGALKEDLRPSMRDLYTSFNTRSPGETVYGNRKDDSPYVTEHVRKFLQTLYPDTNIYETGGFSVYTTISQPVQAELQRVVKSHVDSIIRSGQVRKQRLTEIGRNSDANPFRNLVADLSPALELFIDTDKFRAGGDNGLQAAVVAVDPQTGDVLLLHGGTEFKSDNQFPRAAGMYRQTGSTIKPILYAEAIDEGIVTPATRILDAPLIYRNSTSNWMPENIGNQYDGDISVRIALAKSKNTAAVQIAEKLGLSEISETFGRFFFPEEKILKNRFRRDLSLALGSLELSPLEMASAYSSFANDGNVLRPHLIEKVTDRSGNVVYQRKEQDEFNLHWPNERRAISPPTAEIMIDLLHGSANHAGVRNTGYRGEVAGKTGTTNEYRDAWFIGVRPGISMAVWIGYDSPSYGMGSSALGGTVAAPLWGTIAKLFDATESGDRNERRKYSFSQRAVSVMICPESGKLPGPDCNKKTSELFHPSHVPTEICPLTHKADAKKEILKNVF
ncbi:transglycosylase [Leptospira inadai serovar Lyme str. 10]|uniref:peptidoglycan glycosyltransferase n=2 Tax=Leptospira inadai serovar Lyme TaxID=293084 RepID=V6HWU3_9LEPT|nr:transglycosylase domain-containing protein [Leptospira inadai]EQA37444.1 transglycosylase [Leptospira inadai serovar Lyme str. 10]PNV75054.1 carboxypeptidase [Leptospira inadai serovar Lyme]